MTNIIKTIETHLQHLWVDARYTMRVASWLDRYFAEKYPRITPIPLASTGLGTAAVLGTGTSALVSYGAGKAASCFVRQVNPNYAAFLGGFLFVVGILMLLSKWAAASFKEMKFLCQLAIRDDIPYFLKNRGESLKFDRFPYENNQREQAADFLYRNLYLIYRMIGNGQPVNSVGDLDNRLTEAVELMERHLPHDLRGDGKKVLFEYFNDQQRAVLIKEAKAQLQADLIVFHDLSFPSLEISPFMAKRGAPLRLEPKSLTFSPNTPLHWHLGFYQMMYDERVSDFLYRRLYAMYEVISQGKPVESYVELKDRLAKARQLLERHLSHGLNEQERIVLFEHLNGDARSQFINKASFALFLDLSNHLCLSPTYEEIVRRATPKERNALEIRLYGLKDPEKTIQDLLQALKEGDWDASIFKNKDYPYYALEAVRRGELSQNEYATVMTFWEIQQLHPDENSRKSIAIFNGDGTVNPTAKQLLLKTFIHNKKEKNSPQVLSPEQIDKFFEKLKELPKSEQQFWMVPHIREPIIEEILTPIFAGVERKMIVAPLGMMQAFLDAAFGSAAVKLNPVHGLSSWNDIRQNHLDGTRDYAIHSPGIELPEDADGHRARWFYFGKHDFYHALLISCVPKAYRKSYVECYDILQKLHQNSDPDKGSGFLDMEAIDFFRNFVSKEESSQDLFWAHLAVMINVTISNEVRLEAAHKKIAVTQPNAKELLRLQTSYTEQIVSNLTPIPEIQSGARAIYEKVTKNEYVNPYIEPKILEILTHIWPHLDTVNLTTLFETS